MSMQMSITPQNNNNLNIDDGSKSIVMDLETLSSQYENLLLQYNQATANYTGFLQQQAQQPCGQYVPNSTNISQECYNDIWQKAKCTQPARQLSSMAGANNVTLNSWILDSFNWATTNDSDHRIGCYGHFDSPYKIIGVDMDGYLAVREGLNGTWSKVNDDSNGNIISICTGSDGKMIIGVNIVNDIWTKSSWDAPHWEGPISCTTGPPSYTAVKFISIAQAADGTLVGVGTDHTLWTCPALYNYFWTNVGTNTNGNESENAVCIGPNGRLIVANGVDLYYKESYQNLQNQQWVYACPGCCADITVAPDGTFIDAGACNDHQLWIMDSYLNLNGGWKGPYPSSCCIKSLTTVANNSSGSEYNSATEPNYNINQQPFVAIKGKTFWGTGNAGTSDPYTNIATVEDCEALCSNTNKCTGAVFNPTDHGQPMCWIRTGDSPLSPGITNDYAIIPKGKQLLLIMDAINDQLTTVNKAILDKITAGQGVYYNQSAARRTKTEVLNQNYANLQKERELIQDMIKQYENLDEAQMSGNLVINQNYYSFVLLLALAILFIILVYKFSSPGTATAPIIQQGGELGRNSYYFIFGLLLMILFVHFSPKFISFLKK
jgi:hypothetical protein